VAPQPELCLTTFEEAIEQTTSFRRHLLTGNGFSISAFRTFNYDSLYNAAAPFSPDVDALFQNSKTTDFELVLDSIKKSHDRFPVGQAQSLIDEIRGAFVHALATVHPDSSHRITARQFESCTRFLQHFVGKELRDKGRIYTTNYDLLLYWVIVRAGKKLICPDGFLGYDRRWNPKRNADLVFLHGGLHLFETESAQVKLRYELDSNIIVQTRQLLNRGSFPTIVAEGTSADKADRIRKSAYLKTMSSHLKYDCNNPSAALFIFGHSLDKRDSHLLKLIGEGNISRIYIGAYQGLNSRDIENISYWASTWADVRRALGKNPLPEIWIYDTSKCFPWDWSH